jgi:hypothetical protein
MRFAKSMERCSRGSAARFSARNVLIRLRMPEFRTGGGRDGDDGTPSICFDVLTAGRIWRKSSPSGGSFDNRLAVLSFGAFASSHFVAGLRFVEGFNAVFAFLAVIAYLRICHSFTEILPQEARKTRQRAACSPSRQQRRDKRVPKRLTEIVFSYPSTTARRVKRHLRRRSYADGTRCDGLHDTSSRSLYL